MASNAQQIIHSLESLKKASFDNAESRAEVAKAARSLFLRLETPYQRFQRYGYHEVALQAALITCCNLDLFNKWPTDRNASMTVSRLAEESGANEDVLRRLCKHLASMENLVEVGADEYRLTDYTASLRDPTRRGILGHGFARAVLALPRWLARKDYKLPSDPADCPMQIVTPEQTAWAYLESDPEAGERFNLTMQGMASEWRCAIDVYPVQEKLIQGFKGGVLMVDVGGGIGHDLEAFYEEHAVDGAEYVLQDIEKVVSAASPKPPITKMAHDFFTEQPVKDARCFFLKQIMHDWPDEQAIDILAKIRPAMTPGYTKLLIHDIVVPPTGAPPYTTAIDIFMMSLFGAKERTQADWEGLIEAAGLRLERVWSGEDYRESVLEVVRVA